MHGGILHYNLTTNDMQILTLHVPKSLQSQGLLEVPMQRLARCPLLTVHEHDPACSYSQSHDDGDTIIINLLYIRYNNMIAKTLCKL